MQQGAGPGVPAALGEIREDVAKFVIQSENTNV